MPERVLFYVQHLLGIGHLKRAAAIVAAMAEEGLEVTVAHGGVPVPEVPYPGARVHQLPPASIRGDAFSALIDERGRDVDDAWRARRRDELVELARQVRPDAVLIELFPFGRRQFRFELLPLLDELCGWTPRPAILSSVRDILVRSSRRDREMETADLVASAFDAVLVHGDPAFVPFDRSFGPIDRIADRIRYTGYVSAGTDGSEQAEEGAAAGRGEVLVSAGGGAAGGALLMAALRARADSDAASLDWRVLTGPRLPEAEFDEVLRLAAGAGPGGRVVVERFRADFPQLLRRAALSISQGGYNTTMDLLRARVPAIVVPFGGDHETEQADRAARLAEAGYLSVVSEDEMAAGRLAGAIDAALDDAPRRRAMAPVDFALDGAAATAQIVADHARRKQA